MNTLKSIWNDIKSWFTRSTAFGYTWVKIMLVLFAVITAPLWIMIFIQLIAFLYLFIGGAFVLGGLFLVLTSMIKGEAV